MRPAIVIGLGGTGASIVNNVYGRIPKKDREKVVFFVFDTDMGDMKKLNHLHPINDVISIGRDRTVQQIMVEHKEKRFDYLSTRRDILSNNLSDGAAQVRMLSRFALENLAGNLSQKIVNKITKITSNKFPVQNANLYLVSSVAGGTGSGLLLPLAFSLKNYLSSALQRTLLVKAVVLFPDVYALSNDVRMKSDEKRRVRANAYAFFKEWKTYNDIFRGEYEYKKNLDLLGLQLLDLGGMNALTPDRLKANSDVLDPIDLFVGIDAVSSTGTTLQYLETYRKMTENYLFLDIVSNLGSEAESRLDNALSDFVTTGGMNRMSSFGTSSLEYPYDDIVELAPAILMKNSLNDRWLQIDLDFKKEYEKYLIKREVDFQAKEPVLKDFYIQTFNDYANSGFQQNYFKRLLESMKSVIKDDFGMVTGEVTYENNFFEKMEDNLKTEIKERTFEYKGKSKKIVSLKTDIEEKLGSININNNEYMDSIISVLKLKDAYFYIADNQTERIANDLLRNYLNMTDEHLQDLKREKDNAYNLTHYILGENSTALHPVAVRYFLYKLSKRLKSEKEKYLKIEADSGGKSIKKGKIITYKNDIEVIKKTDYYEETEDIKEDILLAIEKIKQGADKSMFKKIFSNKKEIKEVLKNFVQNTNEEIGLIEKYYQAKVIYNVYNELEDKVEMLIEYWENLFNKMQKAINDDRSILQQKIAHLSEKKQSEEILGSIRLFDNQNLRRDFILARLNDSRFDPDAFDYKITELFYKDALSDFSKYPYKIKDKEDIVNKDFVSMVMDTLEKELKDLKVFDINIIEALITEAKMKKIDKKEYITDKLQEIKSKAGPFMNPSIDNSSRRSFNAWGINDDTDKTLKDMYTMEEYMRIFGEENVLNEGEDFVREEQYESHIAVPAISKYEIIRSNFDYNFRLNNLPAFASVTGLREELSLKNIFNTGGMIYKSYYKQKFDLWMKDEVSTHLDRRWDGLFVLNDLNEGVDDLLEQEVKKAYIRGLAMGWFKSFTDNQTGEHSWKFEFLLDDEEYSLELKLNNDEPAGATFYNLYEALLDNIGLVLRINGYSDEYGNYVPGFFDKQYQYDVEKQHNYDSWHEHRLINYIVEPVPYRLHSGTKYSIFDVFFKLHREKNTKKIKELGKELLRMTISELNDYQKRFGEDTYTIGRVREVVKNILKNTSCCKDRDCGKNGLRENWVESIISLLNYKSRDIELKEICLMREGFYKERDENKKDETKNEE